MRLRGSPIPPWPDAKNTMTRPILILNWKGRWSVYPELSLETRLGGMEVSNELVYSMKLMAIPSQSDMIHAVESVHQGKGPSAVLYIPAVPLTPRNAEYVRDQRSQFMQGRPAPDFPGGVGESDFVGRGTPEDIKSSDGRQA